VECRQNASNGFPLFRAVPGTRWTILIVAVNPFVPLVPFLSLD